jgi:hypothetical protein
MYYPKNKITTNLYTNGGEIYFKGRFWRGKTPNSTPQGVQLFPPLTPPDFQSTNPNNENLVVVTNRGLAGPYNLRYISLKGIDPAANKLLIYEVKPLPTEEDYNRGYFSRFFFYKTNTRNFGETNSQSYRDAKNNRSKYPKGLYNLFTLRWLITGNKDRVTNFNTFSVSSIERSLNNNGFAPYLGYNYLEYYEERENLQSTRPFTAPPSTTLSSPVTAPIPTTYSPPSSGGGTSFTGGGGY